MKALNLYILSFFVLGISLTLEAQRDLYNWKITPQGGIVHYGSEFQLPENTDLYGVGLSLDRRLGRAWTLGVNFIWMESEGGLVESSKYAGARLGFYWDNGFMLSERAFLSPFHKIGFGYGEESIMRNPNSSVIRSGYAFSFENGVKLRFGDRITVELALELLAPEQIVLSGEVAERNRYHIYKLGLNYHFGKRESTFRGPVFRTTSESERDFRSGYYRDSDKEVDKNELTLDYLMPLPMRDTLEKVELDVPDYGYEIKGDTLKYTDYESDSTYMFNPLTAADSVAIFMKLDSLYKRRSASADEKSITWRSDTTAAWRSDTMDMGKRYTTSWWQRDTTLSSQKDATQSWQKDTTATWQRDTTAFSQNDTTFVWRTDTVFIKEMWEPTERTYREEIRYRDAPRSSEERRKEDDRNQEKDRSSNQGIRQTDNRDRRYDDNNQKSTTQKESDRRYEDDRRRSAGNTVVVAGTGGGSGGTSELEEQNRLLREQNELLKSMVSPTTTSPETVVTTEPRPRRDLFVASTPVTPRRDRSSADSTAAEKRLAFQLDSLEREKEKLDRQYQALILSAAHTALDSLAVDSLRRDSLTYKTDSIPKVSLDTLKTATSRDTADRPQPPTEPRKVPAPSSSPAKSDFEYPVVCTFGLNKETPAQGERDKLDQVAADLKKFPERKATLTGHTDGSGNADYNLTLSKKRAQWVADYLTERGVKASQLEVRGKGAQESQEKFQPDERRVVIETTK